MNEFEFQATPSAELASALIEFEGLFETLVATSDGLRHTMTSHGYSDQAAEVVGANWLMAQLGLIAGHPTPTT